MEFDKPSTKYMFYSIIGLAIVAVIGLMSLHISYERAQSQAASDRELACNSLKPKYGSVFEVRSGFYEGRLIQATELRQNQYVRGYIVDDLRPLALVKSSGEPVTLECPILKLEGGN